MLYLCQLYLFRSVISCCPYCVHKLPIVPACTVFAYGATGAGKTYTMLGTADSPGVTFLSVMALYEQIESCSSKTNYDVACSYLEVGKMDMIKLYLLNLLFILLSFLVVCIFFTTPLYCSLLYNYLRNYIYTMLSNILIIVKFLKL